MKFASKARQLSFRWKSAVVLLVLCVIVVVSPFFGRWGEEDISVEILGVRSEGTAEYAVVLVRNGSEFISTMDGDPPDRRVLVRSESAWKESVPTFRSKEFYTILKPGDTARVSVPIPSGCEALRVGIFVRSGSAVKRISSLFIRCGLSMRSSLNIANLCGWLPQGNDTYALRWSRVHSLVVRDVPDAGGQTNSVLNR